VANQFTDIEYQFAARMSAIEWVLEVIAARYLVNDPQAQEVLQYLRDGLQNPKPHVGGLVDAAILQRFRSDQEEFALHLIAKIEARAGLKKAEE
jgi:hypothetical protein